MRDFHYGHIIQIVWIFLGSILQIFLIKGLKGLTIVLLGIAITFIYSSYLSIKKDVPQEIDDGN